jgi:dihydropyrimidinase
MAEAAMLTACMPRPASAPTPIWRSGDLAIWRSGDLAIWDPTLSRKIRHADLHDGSDYTPYEGIEVTGGWPVSTLVRGRVVVEDGKLVAPKGTGTFLPRGKSAFSTER